MQSTEIHWPGMPMMGSTTLILLSTSLLIVVASVVVD